MLEGGVVKLRILHVQETLSPRFGGPASVLPQLTEAQVSAGHEVVIATTNADYPRGIYREPGWDALSNGKVPVLYAPVEYEPLRVSLGLARYLRRHLTTFDIVHIHGLYRFPTTIAARLCRHYSTPYIIRPHGSLDPFLHSRSTRGRIRLKRQYERWLDLPNLNAAGAIHYTAEDERDRAQFLELKARAFVVPNGLDFAPYENRPERGPIRARLGLGDAPIVLFIGRLHPKKGLDLLIPAFEKVRQVKPDAHLVIAGPENDGHGSEVRGWVQEHELTDAVHFLGLLEASDVLQAYVDSDVFALSSYTENFGMTVVEAMACGLPVVISDQVNIHPEVTRASAGFVTRCESDEISQALLELLTDEKLRYRMGAAGRELVRHRYAWSKVVDALDAEYSIVAH
jgi:glycosyltransferase involved in cell wall biosynthesis